MRPLSMSNVWIRHLARYPFLFVQDYVCEQGQDSNHMFVIKRGKLEIIDGQKVVHTMHVGDSFGEVRNLQLFLSLLPRFCDGSMGA